MHTFTQFLFLVNSSVSCQVNCLLLGFLVKELKFTGYGFFVVLIFRKEFAELHFIF